MSKTDKYVSISEAARILKVARPTVLRLARDGKLTISRNPVYAKGRGTAQIPREQVEALAAKPS